MSLPLQRAYAQSSSLKMALLFSVLLGVSACILGYFINVFSERSFVREADNIILNEMENLEIWYQHSGQQGLKTALAAKSSGIRHNHYLLWDAEGRILTGTLPQIPEINGKLAEGLLKFTRQGRVFAGRILTFTDGTHLLVAQDIEDISASYYRMQKLSVLVMVLMLVVVVVSFLISYFVVSRTNRIARTVQEIMATGDLSRRITLDSEWDDLSYLSRTLNMLLERIEQLMQGIKQVADNIAHDLRTPLTRLRNKLEEVQADSPLIAEADHLLQTFSALLRISHLEAGKQPVSFAPVMLNPLLQDVVELYEPLAEEAGKELRFMADAEVSVKGDKDMIFQMITNLVDNALKYAEKGTHITLQLLREEIRIADDGIGIPDAEKERVLERFYRAEQSRHREGTGLGLSLVAAIARHHGFSLKLEDNHPGLRVRIILNTL
jgi:signal transduction histidine kinase